MLPVLFKLQMNGAALHTHTHFCHPGRGICSRGTRRRDLRARYSWGKWPLSPICREAGIKPFSSYPIGVKAL